MRRHVAESVRPLWPNSAAQAEMAAGELVENGIKYSHGTCEFRLVVDADKLELSTTNRVATKRDLDNVFFHVQRIQNAASAHDVYAARLSELLENPAMPGSQLGLYRIAYEGEFELTCSTAGDQLTIVATHRRKT